MQKKIKMSPFIFYNDLNPTVFVAHTSVRISVYRIAVPECIRHASTSTPGSGVTSEFQISLKTLNL